MRPSSPAREPAKAALVAQLARSPASPSKTIHNKTRPVQVDLMMPKKVPGTNLSDYFYWDDHHPYEYTGHRWGRTVHRARARLLCPCCGSGCVPTPMPVAARLAAAQPPRTTSLAHLHEGCVLLRWQAPPMQRCWPLPLPAVTCRAMADLLVAAMQWAVRDVRQAGGSAASRPPSGAAAGQRGQQQRRRQRQWERPALPPPMFPGNYESEQAVCKLGVSACLIPPHQHGMRTMPAARGGTPPACCPGRPCRFPPASARACIAVTNRDPGWCRSHAAGCLQGGGGRVQRV